MLSVIKKIMILLWYIVASFIILVAVIGVALKAFTPVLNQHKAYVEQYASNFLHADVHIERIQADWARFGPEAHFYGITLSQNNQAVLQADELVAHVGIFRTLWRKAVFFRSLRLAGTHISLREVAPQQFLLNEKFLINLADQDSSNGTLFFRWFISQNHIHLTNISVDLLRLNNEAASVRLDQANVYQSKQGFSAFLEGSVAGKIPELASESKTFKTNIMLSVWAGLLEKKLTFAEIELLSRDLVLKNGQSERSYPSLEGVFLWQPAGDNWLLQAKEVTLSKLKKKSSDLSFELWRNSNQYAAHINSINLADLSVFADFFNLTPKNIGVADANIQGTLNDIDVIIPNDFKAINQYQFSGVLRDISSSAYKELPEIHHLSGVVSGSVAHGNFILSDNDDAVYFANYFKKPVTEKQLTTNGQWNTTNKKLSLLFSSMHLVSPKIEAGGQMALDIPFEKSSPAILSLLIDYDLKQSQAALNLLPMKLFSADFGEWLSSAIGQGLGSKGKVLIRGTMQDFPFPKQEGTFIVDSIIKPVRVIFSPEWPAVENASGHMLLHNQAFNADVTGQAQGVALTNAKVSVANYTDNDSAIDVNLIAIGEAKNYLNYIHLSPLKSSLGQSLSPFDFTGRGKLSLHLELPIAHLDADHINVNGQWLAQSVRFFWKEVNLGLDNIKGAISFTKNSVSADHLDAVLVGQPLQLKINSKQEKNNLSELNFDVRGILTVKQLTEISKIDWLSFYLTGSTQYHAYLHVPMTTKPIYSFSFDTNGKGMKINLPENLGKTEKDTASIFLQGSIDPAGDVAQVNVDYQKNIKATIDVQHYSQAQINKRAIQVDAQVENFVWPIEIPVPKTSSSDTSPSLWQSITALKFNVSHLILYKNNFSKFILAGTRQPTSFIWHISAHEAQGSVVVPFDLKQGVNAKFDYLTLQSPTASKSTTTTSTSSDIQAKIAATWPAFFINVSRLQVGKNDLGAVALETIPTTSGVLFKEINISNKIYRLKTQGRWVNEGSKDTTYLEGAFSTKNLGGFLSAYDITKNFQAHESKVTFNVNWPGSPTNFQLKALEGDADVSVKDGVIPLDGDAAKMGLGKVLSLFSAQSIQRRLQLNFSDLGTNGYSFNTLISALHFQAGSANVQKGAFDGPSARIGFTGRVGLVKQDYDLYLVVTPYVTSTLPLLATLAGGPIAGVATYAFDKLASSSIDKFTSYKYLLLGPWSQPKLISLDLEKEKKPEEKNIAPVQEAVTS